jgi:hypothetical protein
VVADLGRFVFLESGCSGVSGISCDRRLLETGLPADLLAPSVRLLLSRVVGMSVGVEGARVVGSLDDPGKGSGGEAEPKGWLGCCLSDGIEGEEKAPFTRASINGWSPSRALGDEEKAPLTRASRNGWSLSWALGGEEKAPLTRASRKGSSLSWVLEESQEGAAVGNLLFPWPMRDQSCAAESGGRLRGIDGRLFPR